MSRSRARACAASRGSTSAAPEWRCPAAARVSLRGSTLQSSPSLAGRSLDSRSRTSAARTAACCPGVRACKSRGAPLDRAIAGYRGGRREAAKDQHGCSIDNAVSLTTQQTNCFDLARARDVRTLWKTLLPDEPLAAVVQPIVMRLNGMQSRPRHARVGGARGSQRGAGEPGHRIDHVWGANTCLTEQKERSEDRIMYSDAAGIH